MSAADVVVGQRRRVAVEQRVGLERQVVERQVRRPERQRGRGIGFGLGHRLARQRVHEVEVDVAEDRQRRLGGGARLVGVVDAAERLQLRGVEALDAERQPVDAGRAEAGELLALEGAGIRLQRDLGVGRQRHAGADAGEQAVDRRRREEARRAAADEHRSRPGGPRSTAARTRGRRAARRRRRPRAASPRASCELKSQYGHLRTHHGMWTYSASGGSAANRGAAGDGSAAPTAGGIRPEATAPIAASRRAGGELRDQRAHRVAAMRQLVLPLERQLGRREAGRRIEEVRVVAEAAVAARRVDDRAVPVALGDDRLGIARRGGPAPARRRSARGGRPRPAARRSASRCCGRRTWARPRSARSARRARRRARARRCRNRRRAPAARPARSRAAPWPARSRRR